MTPDTNPYSSPQSDGTLIAPSGIRLAPIAIGVAVVVGCPILFGVVGGLVAVALNRLAPGYYPGVFSHYFRGNYASIGVATGILQGLVLGALVGVVVAAGLGWFSQLQLLLCARALAIIAAFGSGLAAVGAFLGFGLGVLAPDYYRGVFGGGEQLDFNPVDVGIGLGCSEGLLAGAVVGTVVVVALAWRRARVPGRNH
ncbi:MAG: hypothetical protein ACYC35_07200 [Pirellulales bacterium]